MEEEEGLGWGGGILTCRCRSNFCSPAAMTVCAHVLPAHECMCAKMRFGYSTCPIRIIFSAREIHFYSGCFM